jgi:hypothetical protein
VPDDVSPAASDFPPASSPFQARSPGDITNSLPGIGGGSVLVASTLVVSTPATSAFGSSTLVVSLGMSGLGEVACWSDAKWGDSVAAVAVIGSFGWDMSGAAGPVPMEPVSPLAGSECCSLTFNSPGWVDHLVTFIACEIVTGWGLTEILGSHPGRF